MNNVDTFFPSHFNSTDKRGVLGALALSIVSLMCLIFARPDIGSRDTHPVARLEKYKNEVKYKDSGSVSFYEVSPEKLLHNNDEIFTGDNSQAIVHFLKSKTKITIPASSLVRIEESEEGEKIEIKSGAVDIELSGDQAIDIQINGVRKTLRAHEKGGGVKVLNESGSLRFSNGKDIMLEDLKGVRQELPKEPVGAFNLLSPSNGEKLDINDGIRIISNLNSKYKATISPLADFSLKNETVHFTGKSYLWKPTIDEGNYYLKIEQGTNSQVVSLNVVSRLKVEGKVPADGNIVELSPGENLKLRWDKLPVKSYKVIVKNGLGEVKEYLTQENELVVDNLKGSFFEWSIYPEISKNHYSHSQSKSYVGLKFIGALKIEDSSNKTHYDLKDKVVMIKWSKLGKDFFAKLIDRNTGVELYNKKISDYKTLESLTKEGAYSFEIESAEYPGVEKAKIDFTVLRPVLSWNKKMLQEFKSVDNEFTLNLEYMADDGVENKATLQINHKSPNQEANQLEEVTFDSAKLTKINLKKFGTYCFQAILKKDIQFIENSDEYCFKFIQVPVFGALEKSKDMVLNKIKKQKVESYRIEVPKINKAENYYFEVSLSTNDKNVIFKGTGKKPEILWTTNRSGIYYLRYRVSDIKNRMSDYSPYSKIIFPISPFSKW